MKRKILVLEPFLKRHLLQIEAAAGKDFVIEQLSQDCGETAKAEAIKDAEIIVGQPDIHLLQNIEVNCPKLKFIQMTWAGADIYTQGSVPFPKDYILLANASGTYGMTISQFVIAQILSLMLHFNDYHAQQQQKIWKRIGSIQSLDHAKVLIYGAGDIGSMTAKRLSGFDAYTVGVCRNVSRPRQYFNELCTLEDSERFLPEADVVVCCIPNCRETECFMNERRMKMMKQGAIIVNVGRGNFIDCLALDKLIKDGHLWGAALDVTNPEPLPENHPLWNNPRCIITPHTSGVGFGHLEKTVDLLCNVVSENISRYCNNQAIKNKVF